MTTRTFATWVQPIAEEFRSARVHVLQFARSAGDELWEQPSGVERWTCKDIMSHLAAGTSKQFQTLLRSVTTRTRLDPDLFGHGDEVNARDVEERRSQPIDTMIDEYETDTDELLGLLSQLTEEDQGRRQKDFEQSFGEALPIFAEHEHEHLRQLRGGRAIDDNANVPAVG